MVMNMHVSIKNEGVFCVEVEGSVDFCRIFVNAVFDFIGVADRPPRDPGKVMVVPESVKEMPLVLKEKLDGSPRMRSYWTKKYDKIVLDNFGCLGPDGIFAGKLLPGFTLSEIRSHCQDLRLLDKYGNRVEKKVRSRV